MDSTEQWDCTSFGMCDDESENLMPEHVNYLVVNLEHVREASTVANFTMLVFASISVPDDNKTLSVTAWPHLVQKKGMIRHYED